MAKKKLLFTKLGAICLLGISPTFFVVSCKNEKEESSKINLENTVTYFNEYNSVSSNIDLIQNQLNKQNNLDEKISYIRDFYIKPEFGYENKEQFIKSITIIANPASKILRGSVKSNRRVNFEKSILDFNFIKFPRTKSEKKILLAGKETQTIIKNTIINKINEKATIFFNGQKLVDGVDLKIDVIKEKDNAKNKIQASILILNDSKFIYTEYYDVNLITIDCYEVFSLDEFKEKINIYACELDKTDTNLAAKKLNVHTGNFNYFDSSDVSSRFYVDKEGKPKLVIEAEENSKKLIGKIEVEIIDCANITSLGNDFNNENFFLFTENDLIDGEKKEEILEKIQNQFVKKYQESAMYKKLKDDIENGGVDFNINVEKGIDFNINVEKINGEQKIKISSINYSKLLKKNLSLIVNPYKKINLNDLKGELSFQEDDNLENVRQEINRIAKKIWKIDNNSYFKDKEILTADDYECTFDQNSENKKTKFTLKAKEGSKYLKKDSEINVNVSSIFDLERLDYVKVSSNYFDNSFERYDEKVLTDYIIKEIRNKGDFLKLGSWLKDWDIEVKRDPSIKPEMNQIYEVWIKSLKGSDKVKGEYKVQEIETKSISEIKGGSVWQADKVEDLEKYVKGLFRREGFDVDKDKDYVAVPDIDKTENPNFANKKSSSYTVKSLVGSKKINGSFTIKVSQKLNLRELFQQFANKDPNYKIKEGAKNYQKIAKENFEAIFSNVKDELESAFPPNLKFEDLKENKHYKIIGNSEDVENGIFIVAIPTVDGQENKYIEGTLNFSINEKQDISKYEKQLKKDIEGRSDFGEFLVTKEVKNFVVKWFKEKKISFSDTHLEVSRIDKGQPSFEIFVVNHDDYKGKVELYYFKRLNISEIKIDILTVSDQIDAKNKINNKLNDQAKKMNPNVGRLTEVDDYDLIFFGKEVHVKSKDRSRWIKGSIVVQTKTPY